MRICYFGTYRESYSRNVILIAALRSVNIEVVECHVKLWKGIEDRVSIARGGWANIHFIRRVVCAYWTLLKKYRQVGQYDVMVVGYPGHIDVFLARLLSWIRRKPLVLDVFMSLYLIAVERGLVAQHPGTGWLLHFIEKCAYKLPDLLIQDTPAYKKWLCDEFGVNPERTQLVPTGADNRVFRPAEIQNKQEKFNVIYYGTFIPNHGVMHIMEAANALNVTHDIMFTLIGDGPDKNSAQKYAQEHQLKNVEFIQWLSQDALVNYIGKADVCLGAFGTTPQSMMTVQNKIFECLAMQKPVISGDSMAVRDVLNHLEEVYLVERTNGTAISMAIQHLYQDVALRKTLALNGYKVFQEEFNLKAQGRRFKAYLEGLC